RLVVRHQTSSRGEHTDGAPLPPGATPGCAGRSRTLRFVAVTARQNRPSLQLAAIPPVIGAVVVFGGIALSLAVDQGTPTVPSAVAPVKLPGQRLAGVPANGAGRAGASVGHAPAAVRAALPVPARA